MLALKLLLVPGFLLLVSLAGRRWGPGMAGWLAGLPLVGGPILLVLALERGAEFTAAAAASSLAAVFASLAFSVAYSHACQRLPWGAALPIAMAAWVGAAVALSQLPASLGVAAAVALFALIGAPYVLARPRGKVVAQPTTALDLVLRMVAGALLTVAVSLGAPTLGPAWSGLFTVFPILSSVLAGFSHRSHGADYAVTLLRAMARGIYSFAAFCLVLSLLLMRTGVPEAFAAAVVASLVAQLATRRRSARSAAT